jgi:hypothetical protein
MRACIRIDKLGIGADLSARPPYAPFQRIAHAEFAADLSDVDRFALVGKGGAPRDDEAPRDPRKVGRQVVGNSIREVFPVNVVIEIRKGQHDDRQGRETSADHGNPCGADTTIRRAPRHDGHKTIPAPSDSLDTTALRPTRIEDAAQRRDLDGQVIALDRGSRPDSRHGLVLRDEIAFRGNEHTKQVERARADGYGDEYPAFIQQEQAPPVEAKALEQKYRAAGERLHASSRGR